MLGSSTHFLDLYAIPFGVCHLYFNLVLCFGLQMLPNELLIRDTALHNQNIFYSSSTNGDILAYYIVNFEMKLIVNTACLEQVKTEDGAKPRDCNGR